MVKAAVSSAQVGLVTDRDPGFIDSWFRLRGPEGTSWFNESRCPSCGGVRVAADRQTPDGRPVRVRGCDHWEFRDGKVTRKDSYWKIVEKPIG